MIVVNNSLIASRKAQLKVKGANSSLSSWCLAMSPTKRNRLSLSSRSALRVRIRLGRKTRRLVLAFSFGVGRKTRSEWLAVAESGKVSE